MKVLTLTQPWATLVAIGAKRIETRSWHTNYRGPLAIHAAKIYPKDCLGLCANEPFASALHTADLLGVYLPTGVIVAVCELIAMIPTDAAQIDYDLTDTELAFGDYSPGRWAWILNNIIRLIKPIPAKGSLGLWESKLL